LTVSQHLSYPNFAHFVASCSTGPLLNVNLSCVLMRDGSLGKIMCANCSYPQGGGGFLGLMKWYRDAFYKNEFLIQKCGAINRMPRNDPGGSVTLTRGLRIQARSLYVPEILHHGREVTFAYEFEFDCAPGQSPPKGVLKSRHFEIGEDGQVKVADGTGLIDYYRYPEIGPGMKVFRYSSRIRFNIRSRDCWMQGSFLFVLADGEEFRANINRFTFNWSTSPIV